jgi:3-dehydroquinate synthase
MLQIQSKVHNYSVSFENSFEDALRNASNESKPFFLVDKNVFGLYQRNFSFSESSPKLCIDAIEENKSYEKIAPIFHWLLENGFRKDSTLIVVGGGITQDIGCFIATVLFRGSKWKLIPTTLLAQGDSCIGSKSSINIGSFKNQLGSFYPPHQVHLSFDVLETLNDEAILSGAGEMVKLALLSGEENFKKIRLQLAKLPQQKQIIPDLVKDALNIKKRYIEEDEFDRGIRNILNYGHTFGHGFESATHYEIPHGIAVTLGMMCATFFSKELGLIPESHETEVTQTLMPLCAKFVPALIKTNPNLILSAMKHDKKNTGDKINCILTRGFGKMEKVSLELLNQVSPLLSGFLNRVTH